MGIEELMDFVGAKERPRWMVIWTNTLHTLRVELERVLNGRCVRLGPVEQRTKLHLIVFDSPVPLGSTTEYFSGFYMLQSPSSLLAMMALGPWRMAIRTNRLSTRGCVKSCQERAI
jgi:ribosomal RNA methyltransferase Nop2